jgi:hypothetical protein
MHEVLSQWLKHLDSWSMLVYKESVFFEKTGSCLLLFPAHFDPESFEPGGVYFHGGAFAQQVAASTGIALGTQVPHKLPVHPQKKMVERPFYLF